MLGTRPLRRFRQHSVGPGSAQAESQGLDPEAVRLKALQDQLAAWAYDIDQHRAMQRAVLAKMHGLGTQQAASYGTPFPGSSTTTNNTTTNAGVSVSGLAGLLAALLGAVLVGALMAQPLAAVLHGTRTGPPSGPDSKSGSSCLADGAAEGWQLLVVPAPGETQEP